MVITWNLSTKPPVRLFTLYLKAHVDICKGAPTRKHKVSFNTPPDQHVFVSAMKNPRIAKASGPSQMITVSSPSAKKVAETLNLTSSPARIPTPEGLRVVYRDWNEEFVVYEKA